MNHLESIAERIRADFEARNAARDEALRRSRELIRLCATAIRASHRDEWGTARELLTQAEAIAYEMRDTIGPYPDLLYAGYTQDAMKELVEAHATLALASGASVPEPESLGVANPAYLNGLCEAASEMRRRCLDELRRGGTPSRPSDCWKRWTRFTICWSPSTSRTPSPVGCAGAWTNCAASWSGRAGT